MADHDEILRRQREKMEEHRRWLSQQQAAIREISAGSNLQPHNTVATAPLTGASAATHTPISGRSAPQGNQYQGNQYQSDRPRTRSSSNDQDDFILSRSPGSPLNVHARSTQWARRKEQKLDELKAQREYEDEHSCTFTPYIHDIRYNSTTDKGVSVRGIDNFLHRQEVARQRRDEQQLKPKCDGSKWTGEVTVPEEFHLGYRNIPIKSLRQPIHAPSLKKPGDLHILLHDPTVPSSFDGWAAGGLPPKGVFSERASSSIIEQAASRAP